MQNDAFGVIRRLLLTNKQEYMEQVTEKEYILLIYIHYRQCNNKKLVEKWRTYPLQTGVNTLIVPCVYGTPKSNHINMRKKN